MAPDNQFYIIAARDCEKTYPKPGFGKFYTNLASISDEWGIENGKLSKLLLGKIKNINKTRDFFKLFLQNYIIYKFDVDIIDTYPREQRNIYKQYVDYMSKDDEYRNNHNKVFIEERENLKKMWLQEYQKRFRVISGLHVSDALSDGSDSEETPTTEDDVEYIPDNEPVIEPEVEIEQHELGPE